MCWYSARARFGVMGQFQSKLFWLIGMGLLVRQYRSWDRAERYAAAATAAAKETDADRFERRIALASARVGYSPDDPEAHSALARAYFDALMPHVLKVSPGTSWKDAVPSTYAEKYVVPGLRSSAAARAACPHFAAAHMRLALNREFFTAAEPASAYFARVKRLAPCDPEAWFASGLEAFERGDLEAATNDWKQSLSLDMRQLEPTLKIAARKMSTERIRDRLLPDDTTVLLAAAHALYPNQIEQKVERKPFLTRVQQIATHKSNPGVSDLVALAQVEYEIGNRDRALKAWKMAVNVAPYDTVLRAKYARWLESEELIEPLVSELEWLRQMGAGGSNITDRLDAARHALDLKKIIDK